MEECHRTRKNEKNECHSANNNRLPRRILLHICQFVSFYNCFCAVLIFLENCEIGGVPHYFVWDRVTPIHTRKNKINKCHSTIVFLILNLCQFVSSYYGFFAVLIFLKICKIGGVPHYFVWDRVTPISTYKEK